MKTKKLCCLTLVAFVLTAHFPDQNHHDQLRSQDRSPTAGQSRVSDRDAPHLRTPAGFADEAIGVMTKGQLHNLTMNYGQITDTRFEDVGNAPTDTHFDFRWPRVNYTGLCDDFSLIFARRKNPRNGDNGNVIDGYTDNNNEDWIAKDGAWGKTHYNPAFDPTPHAPLLYANSVPYLAHSDLPDSWPVDATGKPFWPGYFRRDPETGQQVLEEFASDRDIYAVFTDKNNQQGPSLGIEVEMMAYNYGRIYAEDFHFYEFYIKNTSNETLDSCYVGYYMDPDCSDHGEEVLLVPDPTFSDPDILDIIAERDIDGDHGGATRPNARGVLEDYTFGIAILETPKNLGVTSFHYFDDPGPSDDRFLWPIIASDPTDRDIAGFADQYFHGADRHFDDASLIRDKRDLVFIVASGPFHLAPGEVVKSTVAVAAGEDDADFLANMAQAKRMFDSHFQGPSAPPPPRLAAVPGDRRVTLYWDAASEMIPDQATGELDFEGYKIFRSEDAGASWGKPITDSKGNLLGYVPLAQFDVKDGVVGNDPINASNFLGTDSGLRHSWVDNTVLNGIKYAYTIVAYNRGNPSQSIPSFESALGSGIADRNYVEAVPRPEALGKIPTQVDGFVHELGRGKGTVQIEIVDERALGSNRYGVGFSGTPAQRFLIIDATHGDTLLPDLPLHEIDLPVVDGFRVMVTTDKQIGGIKQITDGHGIDVWGIGKVDSSGSWFVTMVERSDADLEARSSDYEIRFTTEGAIAYSWGQRPVAKMRVPFQVWNISNRPPNKVIFEVNDLNNNGTWEEGESIFVINVPYPDPEPTIGEAAQVAFPADFPFQILINNAPADVSRTPPQAGDKITITTFRAFSQDDLFTFGFKLPRFDPALMDLAQIRVVPNPYIVAAEWEEIQNVRKIRFMFLPPVCDINIYTLSGSLVKSLQHDNGTGDEEWNLVTNWNQDLAFGVYVYVVTTPERKKHVGKFALIK